MFRLIIAISGCFSLISSGPPVALPASAPASAAAAITPADRATDDVLQKLFDAVLAAPAVVDGAAAQSLASLLAYSPEAERELRKGVYAHAQFSRAREIRPGVTTLDASITTDRLNGLLSAAMEKLNGARPKPVRLAPTAGPALFASGTAVEDGRARSTQPGWRHCEHRDLIMALRSAEQDLRLRVLACLLRTPLSDRQTVGHLARQQPELDNALRKQVEVIAGSEPVFAPEGVCIITCTLSAGQLGSMAGRALQEAGLSNGDLRLQFASESVTLQGLSAAPPRRPSTVTAVRGPRPEWADRTLSKTAAAAGPPDEPDVAVRNRLATQAARIEAQRQLWMELEQLKLPTGRSIADALAGREDRASAIESINGAIFEMSKPAANDEGVVTITLGLRLEPVWQVAGR